MIRTLAVTHLGEMKPRRSPSIRRQEVQKSRRKRVVVHRIPLITQAQRQNPVRLWGTGQQTKYQVKKGHDGPQHYSGDSEAVFRMLAKAIMTNAKES